MTPTTEQINLIEGVINQALTLDDLNTPGAEAASRALKQLAIELTDRFYGIPQDHIEGEPEYDPEVDGEGEATPAPGGKVKVKIGDDAFAFNGQASAAWLASTKIHELCGHGEQVTVAGEWIDGLGDSESEVAAYNKELEWTGDTGLTEDMIDEVKDRKKDRFDEMPEDRREEWGEREPWLLAFVAGGGGPSFAGIRFDEILGRFKVPTGVMIYLGGGRRVALDTERSLGALSAEYTRSDLGEFLTLNSDLVVPVRALRDILQGPSVPVRIAPLPFTPSHGGEPNASTSQALATLLDAIRIIGGETWPEALPTRDETVVLIPPDISPGGVLPPLR